MSSKLPIRLRCNPECEIIYEDENDTVTAKRKCSKHPGHPNFYSVAEFKNHLPETLRDKEFLDYIDNMIERTVRMTVKFTSRNRPKTYPNTDNPYPYYSLAKTQRAKRSGTGYIVGDSVCIQYIGKRCICHECKISEHPKMTYWAMTVYTATHVIFDDLEAAQTECECFYDTKDRHGIKKLYGVCVTSDDTTDVANVGCVTHDEELIKRLRFEYKTIVCNTEEKTVDKDEDNKRNCDEKSETCNEEKNEASGMDTRCKDDSKTVKVVEGIKVNLSNGEIKQIETESPSGNRNYVEIGTNTEDKATDDKSRCEIETKSGHLEEKHENTEIGKGMIDEQNVRMNTDLEETKCDRDKKGEVIINEEENKGNCDKANSEIETIGDEENETICSREGATECDREKESKGNLDNFVTEYVHIGRIIEELMQANMIKNQSSGSTENDWYMEDDKAQLFFNAILKYHGLPSNLMQFPGLQNQLSNDTLKLFHRSLTRHLLEFSTDDNKRIEDTKNEDVDRYTVLIVSHPHGQSKKITFGKAIGYTVMTAERIVPGQLTSFPQYTIMLSTTTKDYIDNNLSKDASPTSNISPDSMENPSTSDSLTTINTSPYSLETPSISDSLTTKHTSPDTTNNPLTSDNLTAINTSSNSMDNPSTIGAPTTTNTLPHSEDNHLTNCASSTTNTSSNSVDNLPSNKTLPTHPTRVKNVTSSSNTSSNSYSFLGYSTHKNHELLSHSLPTSKSAEFTFQRGKAMMVPVSMSFMIPRNAEYLYKIYFVNNRSNNDITGIDDVYAKASEAGGSYAYCTYDIIKRFPPGTRYFAEGVEVNIPPETEFYSDSLLENLYGSKNSYMMYDTSTCPGSSGAMIHIKSLGMYHPILCDSHNGALKGENNINLSSLISGNPWSSWRDKAYNNIEIKEKMKE